MVAIPPLLATLSPHPRTRNVLGTMHQMSIGAGMTIGLALSLALSRPMAWRLELAVGSAIAAGLLLAGFGVDARDRDQTGGGDGEENRGAGTSEGDGERAPLLRDRDQQGDGAPGQKDVEAIGAREVFTSNLKYGGESRVQRNAQSDAAYEGAERQS
jgi:hypothetical protein